MYIIPNSEIYILKNVPIEPNYNHSLYFNTPEEQIAYFTDINKIIVHLSDYTRIKLAEKTINVEYPVDSLYQANYMMFRNTSFGLKPFFAFITNVEYVNNKTSRITYTLDVVQTWFFEHRLGQCFVVREHSATDTPGDNLLPEDVELGEYVYTKYTPPTEYNMFSEWNIFVCTNWDFENDDDDTGFAVQGNMYQGLYSGLTWKSFTTVSAVNNFIEKMTNIRKSESILSIVMLPSICSDIITPSQFPILELFVPVTYYPNGYVPKNKKLLTAPYTQLIVTDYQGHAATYRYEYFDNPAINVVFHTMAAISSVPQFILTPKDYKGLNREGEPLTYHESLIIGDVPQCAFNIDSYKAWLAMSSNKVGLATDLIQGGTAMAGGLLDSIVAAKTGAHTGPRGKHQKGGSGPDVEALIDGIQDTVSGASQVAATLARWKDASMMPPQAKSIGGGSIVFQTGEYGFHYLYTYIRPEFASIIDDFFTMYGYSTNKLKYPNVRNYPNYMRPYWNYIKVLNCKIDGTLPVEYERILHNIYERGITFWSTPWDVGNYEYDNSPIGG